MNEPLHDRRDNSQTNRLLTNIMLAVVIGLLGWGGLTLSDLSKASAVQAYQIGTIQNSTKGLPDLLNQIHDLQQGQADHERRITHLEDDGRPVDRGGRNP